jgi:hypothetical protein
MSIAVRCHKCGWMCHFVSTATGVLSLAWFIYGVFCCFWCHVMGTTSTVCVQKRTVWRWKWSSIRNVVSHRNMGWWMLSRGLYEYTIVEWVEPCVTTDGQSASLSWNKAPIWGPGPDFRYCRTVVGLLMWSALCDERTDLSFTITAGPRQRSHSLSLCPVEVATIFYCLRF